MLELASWTWRQVPYGQGSAPARRAFHSATAVEGRVVLFGGAARREGAPEIYYQDTWLYMDDDRTWREAWAGKVATAPRLRAATAAGTPGSLRPAGWHAPASAGALRAQAAHMPAPWPRAGRCREVQGGAGRCSSSSTCTVQPALHRS